MQANQPMHASLLTLYTQTPYLALCVGLEVLVERLIDTVCVADAAQVVQFRLGHFLPAASPLSGFMAARQGSWRRLTCVHLDTAKRRASLPQ